jgi:hypothetical protein
MESKKILTLGKIYSPWVLLDIFSLAFNPEELQDFLQEISIASRNFYLNKKT